MEKRGLVSNLELCMGCFACEVACKQERKLPDGIKGIEVVTLGPFEMNGELAMDFVVVTTDACDLCAGRTSSGKLPFCVEICPSQALGFYPLKEILGSLRSGGRFNLCKIQK